MGLSSTTNRAEFACDGSSTVFSFPYYFFSPSDLNVYLWDTQARVVTPQALSTNYTISGTANTQGVYPGGGNVVMNSAAPAGLSLVVSRGPIQTQTFVLNQNQQINSVALVQEFDYLTALVQRLQDEVARSIQLNDGQGSISGALFSQTLPPAIALASSANCPLIVNSGANGWALGFVITGSSGPAGYIGILPVVNGGTGQSGTLTPNAVWYSQNATTMGQTAPSTPNTVLTGNASSAPTWLAYSATGGTSNIASRDANGNVAANNFASKAFAVTSAGGTTVLTAASTRYQVLQGTQNQTFTLPDATTLVIGWVFEFNNNSTGVLTVNDNASGAVTTIPAGGYASVICISVSTPAGSWDKHFQAPALTSWGTGQLQMAGTSLVAPSYSFVVNKNSGFYAPSGNEIALGLNAVQAIDVLMINSSQINFGFGGGAGVTVGNALSAAYTNNGVASFNYSNLSQGTAAVTQFYIGAGASGGNGITVENQAFSNAAYTGGGGLISAGPNLSFLNICAEIPNGYMTFNVGGRTLATERMRLTAGSSLVLNGGVAFALQGSSASGGTIVHTINTSTASHGYVWPQAQSVGVKNLQNDGSGNLSWGTSAAPTLSVTAAKTSNYTVAITDDVVLLSSSNFTVTLYAPTGNGGKVVRLKKTDRNIGGTSFFSTNIVGSAALIDGATSTTINTANESLAIFCDGSNWFTFERRIDATCGSSISPTVAGFGTVSSNTQTSRRVGDCLYVQGSFSTGSVAASAAQINVGLYSSGDVQVDTSRVGTNTAIGSYIIGSSGSVVGAVLAPSSNQTFVLLGAGFGTNPAAAANANQITIAPSVSVQYFFTVPIVGWKG